MLVWMSTPDNGSEFMGEFERACQELGIELVTIALRSPKHNGKVERLQRTFRDEHYAYEPPHLNLSDANEHLDEYVRYYNHERPHMGIGMRTPIDVRCTRNPTNGPHELSYDSDFTRDPDIGYPGSYHNSRSIYVLQRTFSPSAKVQALEH